MSSPPRPPSRSSSIRNSPDETSTSTRSTGAPSSSSSSGKNHVLLEERLPGTSINQSIKAASETTKRIDYKKYVPVKCTIDEETTIRRNIKYNGDPAQKEKIKEKWRLFLCESPTAKQAKEWNFFPSDSENEAGEGVGASSNSSSSTSKSLSLAKQGISRNHATSTIKGLKSPHRGKEQLAQNLGKEQLRSPHLGKEQQDSSTNINTDEDARQRQLAGKQQRDSSTMMNADPHQLSENRQQDQDVSRAAEGTGNVETDIINKTKNIMGAADLKKKSASTTLRLHNLHDDPLFEDEQEEDHDSAAGGAGPLGLLNEYGCREQREDLLGGTGNGKVLLDQEDSCGEQGNNAGAAALGGCGSTQRPFGKGLDVDSQANGHDTAGAGSSSLSSIGGKKTPAPLSVSTSTVVLAPPPTLENHANRQLLQTETGNSASGDGPSTLPETPETSCSASGVDGTSTSTCTINFDQPRVSRSGQVPIWGWDGQRIGTITFIRDAAFSLELHKNVMEKTQELDALRAFQTGTGGPCRFFFNNSAFLGRGPMAQALMEDEIGATATSSVVDSRPWKATDPEMGGLLREDEWRGTKEGWRDTVGKGDNFCKGGHGRHWLNLRDPSSAAQQLEDDEMNVVETTAAKEGAPSRCSTSACAISTSTSSSCSSKSMSSSSLSSTTCSTPSTTTSTSKDDTLTFAAHVAQEESRSSNTKSSSKKNTASSSSKDEDGGSKKGMIVTFFSVYSKQGSVVIHGDFWAGPDCLPLETRQLKQQVKALPPAGAAFRELALKKGPQGAGYPNVIAGSSSTCAGVGAATTSKELRQKRPAPKKKSREQVGPDPLASAFASLENGCACPGAGGTSSSTTRTSIVACPGAGGTSSNYMTGVAVPPPRAAAPGGSAFRGVLDSRSTSSVLRQREDDQGPRGSASGPPMSAPPLKKVKLEQDATGEGGKEGGKNVAEPLAKIPNIQDALALTFRRDVFCILQKEAVVSLFLSSAITKEELAPRTTAPHENRPPCFEADDETVVRHGVQVDGRSTVQQWFGRLVASIIGHRSAAPVPPQYQARPEEFVATLLLNGQPIEGSEVDGAGWPLRPFGAPLIPLLSANPPATSTTSSTTSRNYQAELTGQGDLGAAPASSDWLRHSAGTLSLCAVKSIGIWIKKQKDRGSLIVLDDDDE
ncbi:unnamed protein product [Amoebophrya sp. A25]|nr:unnamed protein product [Amoebophrya sp. A25]|eukprot:GSA25T00005526001.1